MRIEYARSDFLFDITADMLTRCADKGRIFFARLLISYDFKIVSVGNLPVNDRVENRLTAEVGKVVFYALINPIISVFLAVFFSVPKVSPTSPSITTVMVSQSVKKPIRENLWFMVNSFFSQYWLFKGLYSVFAGMFGIIFPDIVL